MTGFLIILSRFKEKIIYAVPEIHRRVVDRLDPA